MAQIVESFKLHLSKSPAQNYVAFPGVEYILPPKKEARRVLAYLFEAEALSADKRIDKPTFYLATRVSPGNERAATLTVELHLLNALSLLDNAAASTISMFHVL
jgi:hypothetical protein